MSFMSGTSFGFHPFQYLYLERKLTMEEMLYKFIDEGRLKHEEMGAFVKEFKTTNELLLKERNNSLSKLRFEVYGLSRAIDNAQLSECEVKGVTTKGGKTTTETIPDTNVIIKEPPVKERKRRSPTKKVLGESKTTPHKYPIPRSPFPNAKVVKGLLSNKTRLEEACTVMMNERCSAVLLNKLPSKKKNPGSFTIPYNIGHLHINNALADLGAIISLIPYRMYEKLDMLEDSIILIILGRPFLATARAIIDVFNKKITLRVGNEEGLLENDQEDSFLLINLEKCIDQSDLESCGKMFNASEFEIPIRRIKQVLEKHKGAIAWKMSDKKGISLSFWFFQIPIAPEDQDKTTFTCPYRTFGYRRMPFGLCNAPATFQRCMTAIFHDMVEDFMEVFMEDFSVFGNSFDQFLANLDRMLASKHDAKPRFIWWVLLLQGFNIKIKDKKGAKNLATDHMSRLENPNIGELTKNEIADEFLVEHLMILKAKLNDDEPWYADYVKYIIGKVIPPKWIPEKRKRFFSQVKNYFWDEPYAFRLCPNNAMRRCVAGDKILEILAHCHSGLTEGHHSALVTEKKVCDVFDVWGLDFMGHFPHLRGNKYILVVVDYVSKWVEAQALPINDARMVVKFLRGLFPKFGVPKALISDRGTHFCNSQLEKALQKYGVTHKISTIYHPQTNGQTEVTNKAIKCILERSIRYNPKDWSKKLNDALWAFRTAYKTPTGCNPFRLVYGKACHLPVEIEHKAYWALKQCNMDLTTAAKNRFMELNELMELRDGAYENNQIYKEKTKKWHDSRLQGDKNFKIGDKVLLFNSHLRLHPGKLKSKWSGPFIVKTIYPYGAVEITDKNGSSFKVNGQRLKKYYNRSINTEDDEFIELDGTEAAIRRPCGKEIDLLVMVYSEKDVCCTHTGILTPLQHTFAQELKLKNHLEQNIKGVPRSNSISYIL
ncbi:reverse transcriptase domain-containing protein [Tanacetum coccineum]